MKGEELRKEVGKGRGGFYSRVGGVIGLRVADGLINRIEGGSWVRGG